MMTRCFVGAAAGWLLLDSHVLAAGGQAPLDLPLWSVAPFVGLLLCIALLPLFAGHWWHKNRNKALVAALAAAPVVAFLCWSEPRHGPMLLRHELLKYLSFIALLGSLFTVSGGIVFRGDLEPRPWTNASFLAAGGVLANFIGTTGASVLLIRPLLRINRSRKNVLHLPVFFIFIVSNVAGLLTPLGDPPLFLGFLYGIPFEWTLLNLWPHWLVVNGLLLALFVVFDGIAYARESAEAKSPFHEERVHVHLIGGINFLFLAGIILGVLVQSWVEDERGELIGVGIMLAMAVLSLVFTPRRLREANGFSWTPIIEVGVLFLGIFIAMVPALEILKLRGKATGVTEPWQYFWITGALSSFLDNAPTYVAFATLAAADGTIELLPQVKPLILAAISTGAVFFGAMTYIGNGPNFMVKAIAEEAGYKTPGFFGYLLWSCLILLPIFGVVTVLFFPP